MGDFDPAPGTRVTVDGVTWEVKINTAGEHYYEHHPPGVEWKAYITPDDERYPDFTRIAKLEAEVAQVYARLRVGTLHLVECNANPNTQTGGDMCICNPLKTRLARYAALGKEAADSGPWGPHQLSTDILMRLAAEWRAQQEGR